MATPILIHRPGASGRYTVDISAWAQIVGGLTISTITALSATLLNGTDTMTFALGTVTGSTFTFTGIGGTHRASYRIEVKVTFSDATYDYAQIRFQVSNEPSGTVE